MAMALTAARWVLFNYILKGSRMLLLRHISLVISCAYLPAALAGFPCTYIHTYIYICILLVPLTHLFIIYIFSGALLVLYLFFSVYCLWKIYACPCLFMSSVVDVLWHVICAAVSLPGSRIVPATAASGPPAPRLLFLLFPSLVFPKGCSNQRRWMNPLWAAQIKPGRTELVGVGVGTLPLQRRQEWEVAM